MMLRTSTLWMIGVTLAVGVGAGCVSDGDDEGEVLASWDLAFVEGDPVDCSGAGTSWVRLDAKARNAAVGAYSFDFPCAAKQGRTTDIPAGAYDITLSLLDAKMQPVNQISGAYVVSRRGVTPLTPVLFAVQSWRVSWILTKAEPGGGSRSTTCDEMGVRTVELHTRLASDPEQIYPFDCRLGLGVTQAIRTGNYAWWLVLIGQNNQVINMTSPEPEDVGDKQRPRISAVFPFN